MEIAKLYELAAEKLEKAIEVCGKAKLDLSNLTVIAAISGNVYCGINWKRLNDSFEEEPTHSEDEALSKMLLAGETAVEHIVTLDASTKLPVDPSQKALELLIKLNYNNTKSNVLQGKNSKVVLTSVNSEIAKFAEQLAPPPAPAPAPAPAAGTENNTADGNAGEAPKQPALAPGEPEGSAAHAGIDASGLQMIFDDWESSADKAADGESKPFNGNSLSDKAEVINQVQNMAGGFQQQSGMYGQQQPMNGMYGGQGMYQQQGMNGMYGGQPMNGMYGQQSMMYNGQPMQGMYGQQQPMNGMYGGQPMYGGGQPMNGMYGGQPMYGGGQPMNGMYGAGQQSVYGQQMNTGRQSLYLNNNNHQPNGANNNGAGQQSVYAMPATTSSAYRSKLQAPVTTSSVVNTQSVSVYGTNIGEGDNNAIFKDRLADILNSSGSASKAEDNDKTEVMMSAKEKKNAAKKGAKSHH